MIRTAQIETVEPIPEPSVRSLGAAGVGARGVIASLAGTGEQRLRLLELGFCPGTTVSVIRRAPLGCPLEVDLDGTHFAVPRALLAQVWIADA